MNSDRREARRTHQTLPIRAISANMARSNTTTHAFWQDAHKEYDIIFMQEPWWEDLPRGARGSVHDGGGWSCVLPIQPVKPSDRPRVLTYVRKRKGLSVVPRYDILQDLDAQAVEVRNTGRPPILVVNVYNEHPLCTADGAHDLDARRRLPTMVNRVLQGRIAERLPRGTEIIWVGDYNLHHPAWETAQGGNKASRELYDWMQEHQYTLLNQPDEWTHFPRNGGTRSVLDLMFVNATAARKDTAKHFCVDPEATASDHAALRWSLNPALEAVDNTFGEQWNWKKADVEAFKQSLSAALEDRKDIFDTLTPDHNPPTELELDAAAGALQDAFDIASNAAVPRRKDSTCARDFWDADLDAAKATASAAKAAYAYASSARLEQEATEDDGDDERPSLRNTAIHTARRLKRLVQKKKAMFYAEKLKGATAKGMWDALKMTRGRREYPSPPMDQGPDQPRATEHADKCRALRNTLFAPPPDLGHRMPDLTQPQENAIAFDDVTRAEVRQALFAPDPDKAPGPRGTPNRALRWAWDVASDVMYHLIAHCARKGYHPQPWRDTISVGLRKMGKPDYGKARAWRLIQCEDNMGKALESVEATRIAWYAQRLGIFADTQFGGVPGRSVEDAAHTFAHDVETAARAGLITSSLTFDITGYFDRVSHPRLITVMRDAGMPSEVVRWVASFLSNRRTAIRLDGETGPMEAVTTGIPQGSPVSPVLAAIFSRTLDIRIAEAAPLLRQMQQQADQALEGRLIMYVDDGKLYVSSRSMSSNTWHLRALYKVAREWARAEGLELDDAKQDAMHYTGHLRKIDGQWLKDLERPSLYLPNNAGGNTVLQPTDSYRWLGIFWDPKLRFESHVRRMMERGHSSVTALHMLGNSVRGLRPTHLRTLHMACTMSILTFGASVWYTGERQKTLVEKLSMPLRRAMRQITGAFRSTPVDILHLESSLPPLDIHLERRRNAAATRMMRMPRSHAVIQRLGNRWTGGTGCSNPPPMTPRQAAADQTRLQRLAALGRPDGERTDTGQDAPWQVWTDDARWRGRAIAIPKPDSETKRTATLAHERKIAQLKTDSRAVVVYTDGSLLDGVAGAGYVIMYRGRVVSKRAIGLGRCADVYDGELFALQCAARPAFGFALGLPISGAHVYFFADNDAAVRCILARAPRAGQHHSVVFTDTAEAFLNMDDTLRLTVEWVPGHEGIFGQEISDEMAKAGTILPSSLPHSLTLTRAARNATKQAAAAWTERWHLQARRNAFAPADRFPPSLRPTPHLQILDKRTLARLVQCRSGHAFTGEYNRAVNKPERGLACTCGRALQTRDHLLVECPDLEQYRYHLRNASPALHIPTLLGTREGIRATSKFIAHSGAFSHPTAVAPEEE